jgi:hypothetical protein
VTQAIAYRDALAALERRANGDVPYAFAEDAQGREVPGEAWTACPVCGEWRLKIEDVGGVAVFDCRQGCKHGDVAAAFAPMVGGATEQPDDAPDGPFAVPLDEFIAARSELPPALIGDAEDVLLPAAGFLILGWNKVATLAPRATVASYRAARG